MKKVNLTIHDKLMISSAALILSANLEEHITITRLAGMVNITEKKLKVGFMEQFGKGVYTYLKHIRMEKIKILLLEDRPLKAIALMTGYKGENALIKAFRRENGVPPAHWKRQQGDKMS